MAGNKPESILVFGAGGHARSVIDAITHGGDMTILGLLEEAAAGSGNAVMGHAVLGGFDVLERGLPPGCDGVALAIGDNAARARIGQRLGELGVPLCRVVHPLACVAMDAALGKGCFVHGFAYIGSAATVGTGAIVSAHCTVGHGSDIGDWAHLTPGVRLGGDVRIGKGAFLGMGCAILPGVRVGAGASVGANAVVHKDIADGAVVVGNPARTIRGGAG